MFGLLEMMSLATVANIKSIDSELRPQIYLKISVNNLEDINTLFDNTINVSHTMIFAANQDKNDTYKFKYMLRQDNFQ